MFARISSTPLMILFGGKSSGICSNIAFTRPASARAASVRAPESNHDAANNRSANRYPSHFDRLLSLGRGGAFDYAWPSRCDGHALHAVWIRRDAEPDVVRAEPRGRRCGQRINWVPPYLILYRPTPHRRNTSRAEARIYRPWAPHLGMESRLLLTRHFSERLSAARVASPGCASAQQCSPSLTRRSRAVLVHGPIVGRTKSSRLAARVHASNANSGR